MQLNELKELGLTEGQAQTYSALLEFGDSGIQKIQEKTGLNRRAIYDILNKLVEKGYATYIEEKGIRKYQVTHPKNILSAIEEKEKSLQNLKNKIPQITSLFQEKKNEIDAEVYRGNEAIKSLFEESLEYKATYWIGGNSGVESCNKEMALWFKRWMIKRVNKKQMMYDLVDYGSFLEDLPPKDIKKHKANYYKYCQLPKELSSPMVICIFGNKVVQLLWSQKPFAFVLDSKEIKDSFMKYFEHFWREP